MSLSYKGFALRGRLVLYFLTIVWHLNAQVFPLKVNGSHLTTKNQKPFLVNGRWADIYGNFTNELNNLQRYVFLDINTALVYLPQENMLFTTGDKPAKELKKQLNRLKRFAREASLYNVAVFISTEGLDISDAYLKYAFKTMGGNKNVSWIITNRNLSSIASTRNKNQLIGCEYITSENNSADYHIYSKTSAALTRNSKPFILINDAVPLISDSVIQASRSNAYAAIMNGTSGVITIIKANTLYNPVSQQMKQLKVTFDSLSWHRFVKFPEIISPEATQKITAVRTTDSLFTVIYLKNLGTIQLNLSSFNSKLKFSWINTLTGKNYEANIKPDPQIQVFMPPLAGDNENEWILIIRSLSPKKLQ